MSNDPFNIVKEEVKKSISKTKSLIESYQAVVKAKKAVNDNNDDEDNDTTSPRLLADIRTILKSINWDVQDLEETIKIASKNPSRFNLSNAELESRNQFVEQSKEFIQKTKQTFNIDFDDKSSSASSKKPPISSSSNSNSNINIRIPDLISTTSSKPGQAARTVINNGDDIGSDSDYDLTYARSDALRNASSSRGGGTTSSSAPGLGNSFRNDQHAIQMQHQELFKEQEKSIDLISGRVSSLKNISQAMQNELDDQAQLLDDMGREMETADSRMNNVMKRITKVLHMSSDKRQWTMIGVLLLGIFILLILFAIL